MGLFPTQQSKPLPDLKATSSLWKEAASASPTVPYSWCLQQADPPVVQEEGVRDPEEGQWAGAGGREESEPAAPAPGMLGSGQELTPWGTTEQPGGIS